MALKVKSKLKKQLANLLAQKLGYEWKKDLGYVKTSDHSRTHPYVYVREILNNVCTNKAESFVIEDGRIVIFYPGNKKREVKIPSWLFS